jgi:hypothetical protein
VLPDHYGQGDVQIGFIVFSRGHSGCESKAIEQQLGRILFSFTKKTLLHLAEGFLS